MDKSRDVISNSEIQFSKIISQNDKLSVSLERLSSDNSQLNTKNFEYQQRVEKYVRENASIKKENEDLKQIVRKLITLLISST